MTGRFSMRCSCALVAAVVLACGTVAVAQGPTYHLGRTPTEEERKPWDAAIGIDGEGLPQGSGTAKQGATIYITRGCAGCHGHTGVEGPAPPLVGPARADHYPASTGGYPGSTWPGRGIRNFPFAPLIWSFINTAMPLQRRGYLKPDELYSLTAYLLHLNGIIAETDVMDATTLPQVQMPNRKGYVPPPFSVWRPGMRQAEVR
jgi:mono/diheme cytochrome c family protein